MTPTEQRIAIAEACGWTGVTAGAIGAVGFPPGMVEAGERRTVIPDYLGSLDAMNEAEEVIKRSPLQWVQYCNALAMLCGGTREDDGGIFVSHKEAIDATASQRAEAFLRTLNLWKP